MKIFTMVKGEQDIVEDWVLYHGSIFGYNNLYIIDNYSKDGTYQTLLKLRNMYNIHVSVLPDYTKKGEYMTTLLKQVGQGDIVFPIDIDEFIVYYNKTTNEISCDKNTILEYLKSLPSLPFYKMNYISAKIGNPIGYPRATVDSKYGKYLDYGNQAKTFFNSRLFRGVIDHGNHYVSNTYWLSDLCLVHFHQRNIEQIKKKVYNNVKGFKHDPFNLTQLKHWLYKNPKGMGVHHVQKQIQILEHTFSLDVELPENNDISLSPLNYMLVELDTMK